MNREFYLWFTAICGGLMGARILLIVVWGERRPELSLAWHDWRIGAMLILSFLLWLTHKLRLFLAHLVVGVLFIVSFIPGHVTVMVSDDPLWYKATTTIVYAFILYTLAVAILPYPWKVLKTSRRLKLKNR